MIVCKATEIWGFEVLQYELQLTAGEGLREL
jgi:hypothetical protein